MTKPLQNTWVGLRNLINEKYKSDSTSYITRKEIREACGTNQTVDYYRRCLTVVGYLKDSYQTGKYEIRKFIPYFLSSSDLRKQVDSIHSPYSAVPAECRDTFSKSELVDYLGGGEDMKVLPSLEKQWCSKCYKYPACKEPCIGLKVEQSDIVADVLKKLHCKQIRG